MKAKSVLIACAFIFASCFSYGCKHTVTYDGNGATSGSVPADPVKFRKGATVTVLGNTGGLAKEGVTFGGWNTAADGSAVAYSQADTFTMGSANVLLYARWASRWTTLLGVSGSITYGYGIAVDASGNSYVTGWTDGALDGQTVTGTKDVFVIKYDASGAKQWTRLLGVSGVETSGAGIAVDASGNSYVTGNTGGALDGEALTGVVDVFVVKYDTNGAKQWTRLLGVSGGGTSGKGIAVDASGNSYAGGWTDSALDGQTLTGTRDVFVIKYDTNGAKQWTRLLGASAAYTQGFGIAADPSGNSYVTGNTSGALDGQTLTGSEDVFVLKYDTTGAKQWTRQLGVSGTYADGYGIAADASGNSYATGITYGALDGQTLTGTRDVFVVKYDATGAKQWTRQLGVSAVETKGNGIAVDASGNSYAAGTTYGALDGQTVTGGVAAFVIKYDATGAKQWTRQLGVSGVATKGNGIALDAYGNSFVTGYTGGALDGQTVTGIQDVFVTTQLNP